MIIIFGLFIFNIPNDDNHSIEQYYKNVTIYEIVLTTVASSIITIAFIWFVEFLFEGIIIGKLDSKYTGSNKSYVKYKWIWLKLLIMISLFLFLITPISLNIYLANKDNINFNTWLYYLYYSSMVMGLPIVIVTILVLWKGLNKKI